MKYAVLIYASEAAESQLSEDEWQVLIDKHTSFFTKHHDSIIAGEALQPTPSAKTLRIVESAMTTLDGPFAETKEQLGGIYLLEAASIEEVVAMAKELPLSQHGSIEIRPVMAVGETDA